MINVPVFVTNTWRYLIAHRSLLLFATVTTVTILGGSSKAAIRKEIFILSYLSTRRIEMKLRQVRAASAQTQFHIFLYMHICNSQYSNIHAIPQPSGLCPLRCPVLAKSCSLSAWSSWGVCQSSVKPPEKRSFLRGSTRCMKMWQGYHIQKQ